MPPAPRRRSRRGLWIALGVILLVLVVCSAAASQLKGTSTAPNTNTQSTQPAHQQATQPVATPTQAQAQGNVIGKPVQINDTWTVTLNSVSTSKGTDFNKPKSGNIFLVVNVTLKNTSTQNQTASSLTMFSLKDGTGQTYDQNVFQGKSPDGTVAAGGVIRGDIAYEVPTSIHNFTLQCTPSLGTNDLAEWAVKI